MHISGILVICEPSSIDDCLGELERTSHVDVHVTDRKLGRIIVTLDTETLEEQEDGLRRLQQLPHVVGAELVHHYFGDAKESGSISDQFPAGGQNGENAG